MAQRITDIELPPILYKFRDERNWEHHHRMISHQEIYLARPSQYNDPFDCRIPIRSDLMTDEERTEQVEKVLRIVHTEDNFIKRRIQEIKVAKELWFSPLVRKEDKEMLDRWDKPAGVFSLSEVNNNILMWSHYANQHKGFVVGVLSDALINMKELVHLDYINYCEEFPLIKGVDDTDITFYKKFFYKSHDWKYEREWRIVTMHTKNRIVILPKSAFVEVILGSHMDKMFQEKFIKQIRKALPDVNILKAVDNTEKFEVEIKTL